MFSKLILLFRIPELRQKILLTLILLAVYRMGSWIPLPFIDQEVFTSRMTSLTGEGSQGGLGQVIQIVSLFSASQLGNATIFGLGIMPYISASIIFQLMGSVYPPLERLKKEGEAGQRKINEYTRYATVVICLACKVTLWVRTLAAGFGGEGSGGMIMDAYNTLQFLPYYWCFRS